MILNFYLSAPTNFFVLFKFPSSVFGTQDSWRHCKACRKDGELDAEHKRNLGWIISDCQ